MIKYRIAIEVEQLAQMGGMWYYTGRLDRYRSERDAKYSYANGWSQSEEAAKLYPESQKKAAIAMAKQHKAELHTISFEPEVLDIKNYGD